MKTPHWSLPRALAFLGALLSFASLASLPAAIPAAALPVAGTNLSVNKYQSPAVYWNDAIRGASSWSGTTPPAMPVDADGWPTDLLGSTGVFLPIFLENGSHYPTGDYVLSWTGNGDLTFVALGATTPITLTSSTVTATGGRRVYHVPDNSATGFRVRWNSTAPASDNVRDVHLWLPGQENSPHIITDTVAAELAPFEVLRMMDWGETNGNLFVEWSDRTNPHGPLHNPVPYETMVAVCNELNKDLWICIPSKASDDFIVQLATMIRDNLNPGLVCWVEYSNEIWNTGAAFAKQTNYVNNTFPGANLEQRYAYRSGQIFTLFSGVFGADASARLMRVCASQATLPSRSQKRLAALGANVDVLAIADYFGRGSGPGAGSVNQWIMDNWNDGALTFAQMRDFLITSEIDASLLPQWAENQSYADAAGVPMISYEGGQHMLDAPGNLSPAQQTFVTNFQVSPEMGQAQRHALDRWRALGAKTHVIYTNYGEGAIKGGFWGHKQYSGQPLIEAPKWQAVLDWIADASQPDTTPPSIFAPADLVAEATGPDGATVSFTATAHDDTDGVIPVTASPASGSVFPLGATTVALSATDAAGNVATAQFTVTVRDTTAPVISALSATPDVLRPANHKLVPITLAATAADAVDPAPVTHIVAVTANEPINGPGDGNTAADWQITGPLALDLRAERAGNAEGRIYTITVESRDAAGNTTTRDVTVTVPHDSSPNAAPTLDAPAAVTINEDAATQTVNLTGIGDGDYNTQSLTVSAVSSNPALIPNPVVSYASPAATGSLTFTPTPNAHGTATITVAVRDSGGVKQGGVDTTTRTFTVTVNPVNDAPGAAGQSATTNEDTPKFLQLSASDVDGDALTYVVVDGPAHGTLSGTGSGFTYTPAANYSGPDSFIYQVNDGAADSAPATVNLTVNPLNDAPEASAQSAELNEDTSLALTLAGTDAEGDPLTYAVVSGPAHGTLSGAAPNLVYTPAADYVGTDSFTFKANDGLADGVAATVYLTMNPVNDAPRFTKGGDQSVAAATGAKSLSGWASAISAGPADEAGQALTFAVSNDNPALFAVQPAVSANGTLSFTPAASVPATATATVTVQLLDNGGTLAGGQDTSAAQTFTITVSAGGFTETFDNTAFTNAFASGSWLGNAGQTWTYTTAKAVTLNGKAAWLRGTNLGTLATIVATPVKSVSLAFRARTATSAVQLELLVNGVVVATSPVQNNTTATWNVSDLAAPANAEIKIRNKLAGEAVVDDISIGY